MRKLAAVQASDIQAVYSGPEGDLWKLVMGEQIHIGGMPSSIDLAEQAGIAAGSCGVDLCCCLGAGMQFLVRMRSVQHMTGVDFTPHVLEQARDLSRREGLADRVAFCLADVTSTGLPSASVDFVWGEDAWCYVPDKAGLIAEAARLVRPGGTIAFTDWLEGPSSMTDAEAGRYMRFMKFPTLETIEGYADLLKQAGCCVRVARDTGRFAPSVDLYMNMLTMQLQYDALKILGFDVDLFGRIGAEFAFVQRLAHEGKISQGQFVAYRE
jgi:SAM-dependent methyltransferase